jgi:L-asparaginase
VKKRIFICNTGGTIGMKRSLDGYQPRRGYLAELLQSVPELNHPEMPDYELHEFEPLLDSANMRPENWLEIAKTIHDHHQLFDGFVVIHGTDTMAYTASALPFLLKGLNKPVILTGSQIPLCEIRNDARENLITSLKIAADHPIPETAICFGGFLLRGCRARKVTANGFNAFQSPNYPPLGRIGTSIDVRSEMVLEPIDKPFKLAIEKDKNPQVAAFRLFPGIDHDILVNLFQPPLKGIVIEAFGVGNAPNNDKLFLQVIQEATNRGVIVVVCTQCTQGRVDLTGYSAGQALQKAGAISGSDMTVEAALAKLYFLLNQNLSADQVRQQLQQDLVGEITVK